MIRLSLLLMLLIPFSASAGSLKVNFTEGNFLGQYRHETYIKDNNYLFVDDHFEYTKYISGQNATIVPYVPDFYSITLSNSEIKKIIETLKNFGISKWKKQYKTHTEKNEVFTCDGLTYSIYIETEDFKVESSGSCFFPDNYNEVATYLMSLHQSPNKKSQ